jgi:glycosyltransferase involved in cell wall biosynthesis|tara:strand:+ start:548 stop:1252 length:705 start_codon:yes stop_codon:yes gene_type:complete
MKVVFISPCFNASNNLKKLIDSVTSQIDSRWEHVLIDDISTDNTSEKYSQLTSSDSRFKLIKNNEKKYALRNIIEVARNYENDEDTIIATIDGDDQLCNENTVSLLIESYEKGFDVVWTGHRWDVNGINISKAMPENVDPYAWVWSTSHLRTFKSTLLKKISDRNFKDTKGAWFKRGYDQALMLPVLSLTNRRKYIDEICYLYNIDSVSVNDRDWAEMSQISTINLVRARGFLK